jgi:glycosyltransferase involved in cell wall biosynthesis
VVPADSSFVARLEAQVRELERIIRARTAELEAADRHIASLEEKLFKLKELSRELKQLKQEKHALRKSPERKFGQVLLAPYRLPQKLIRALRRKQSDRTSAGATEYQRWFEKHRAKPEQLRGMRDEARTFANKPLISVIVPVFNTAVPWLAEAIESVAAQAYENWELILVDDASTYAAVQEYLAELKRHDSKLRIFSLEHNRGISAALNYGIEQARGDWVGFLDHDDVLEPDALFQTAKLLQRYPDADLIYSDEDKITDAGVERPQFKPDWSPDLFLSGNYVSHFTNVRRELVRAAGGFRSEFDGAQDYDLLLRIIERTNRIHHVPRVLYHWRRSASSSAIDIRQKPGQLDAARRAVEEHLQRGGINARVAIDWPTHTFWVQRHLVEPQKIAIVSLLSEVMTPPGFWLESLSRTRYPNYEIVLVGNEKQLEQVRQSLSQSEHQLLNFSGPLNCPAAYNFAVAQTDSPWLLFVQSGLQPSDDEWLGTMAEHIQRAEVGAVGPLLLRDDNTIVQAGLVLDTSAIARPAMHGLHTGDAAILRRAGLTRNCSAVAAACLLTRRDIFARAGGFDERLPGAFYDVDLCLKLRRSGYLIVYTPFARLYQRDHEACELPADSPEGALMRERWAEMLQRDPYYNPNLSRARADFSLGN